ncbi:DUF6917 domain-containing protein [Streptomyces sp. NPDC053474]|uniref:DUF6917 domain-containing protein n=1 Tax=Streptomyces sp. NPDC053474 TaxID=3365704 RepID=UPI0037D77851
MHAAVASLPWEDEPIAIHFGKRAAVARVPGFTCVHDTGDDHLYVVDDTHGRVVSLGVPSAVNARDLARQTRELLLDGLLSDGWVVLHSSAVARSGRALVFVGDKGSGKTTLALKMLGEHGFEYLANDRLLARVDTDGRIELRPYALSVRLGGGTLRNHPKLRRHLHYFDHFDAAVLPLERQFAHEDKLELTVGEYADILDVTVADHAVVDHVFLPTLDFDGDDPQAEVEAPRQDDVLAGVEKSVLIPDPDGSGWLRALTGGTNELTTRMAATLRALAAAPSHRLRGHPEAIREEIRALTGTPGADTARPSPGWLREPLPATTVCVLHHRRVDRELTLAPWQTRAVNQGEVHELLVVDPAADLSEPINDVGYLGFASFDAGLLVVGDTLLWNGHRVAELLGFDDTHLPNHMNIVFRAVDAPHTGYERGLRPGDVLTIEPRP